MLNNYLVENYNKLKDVAYNITNGKHNDDLLSFVIEELYKCDTKRINEIIKKKQMTFTKKINIYKKDYLNENKTNIF